MESRTIALHGGGDLVIGGGPPIDGVLHGWIEQEGKSFAFMLDHGKARELADALRTRASARIRTFTGHVQVSHTRGLACLWFYPWGEPTPELGVRIYDAAIDVAAEAVSEVVSEGEVLPWAA